MTFIDTNIFIRYMANDDKEKARACFELFQRVKRNEEEVTTSESVLAEVELTRFWGGLRRGR